MNELLRALEDLNESAKNWLTQHGIEHDGQVWKGRGDSLSVRNLKKVYPDSSGNESFISRATYLSNLVIDELYPKNIRKGLHAFGQHMHLADPTRTGSDPLGSRKLFERLVLASRVLQNLQCGPEKIPALIKAAETNDALEGIDQDLAVELVQIREACLKGVASLAFLYELRRNGGIAHQPNPEKFAKAASHLGLPKTNWKRRDYLTLLEKVTESIIFAIRDLTG